MKERASERSEDEVSVDCRMVQDIYIYGNKGGQHAEKDVIPWVGMRLIKELTRLGMQQSASKLPDGNRSQVGKATDGRKLNASIKSGDE